MTPAAIFIFSYAAGILNLVFGSAIWIAITGQYDTTPVVVASVLICVVGAVLAYCRVDLD